MKLYSREDCPLCEDVEENLVRLNVKYTFVDIDSDEILRKEYHVRIPVLENNLQQELAWPFDDVRLMEFLQR
ncbi:MAG: glutaredoxin family protein [Proteobacteria bacterium]|nr:glutaredoxin family protein [Pseudomonadota bacterium]